MVYLFSLVSQLAWFYTLEMMHIIYSYDQWMVVKAKNSKFVNQTCVSTYNVYTPFLMAILYSLTYKSESHVWLFMTPWTIAHQIPLSIAFSRQEYWNGSRFSSPRYLSDPGLKYRSLILQADSLLSELPGKLYKPKLMDVFYL